MAITLPSDKTITVKVLWVDKNQNPAVVDGPTTWTSGDPTLMAVTVDTTDSTKATISAAGPGLGTAQLSAKADADIGTGVQEIIAMADVTVVAGTAVAGTIEVVP